MKKYCDLDLVRLINLGNKSAFSELYERYWEMAYDLACKQLQDEVIAKDIVHDVFFSIWTKKGKLLIDKSFPVYLRVCLKHKIIDEFRKKNLRLKQAVLLSDTWQEADNPTIEHLFSKDLALHIKRTVNHLPEKMKAVYKLSREEELSVDEISTRLSLSPQTVKNQISNALKRLRISIYSN